MARTLLSACHRINARIAEFQHPYDSHPCLLLLRYTQNSDDPQAHFGTGNSRSVPHDNSHAFMSSCLM